MKHLQVSMALIILLCSITQLASEQPNLTQPIKINSEYVIAFDLHGVLFSHNWDAMWQEFKKAPFTFNTILTVLNPFFIYSLIKTAISSEPHEEIVTKLIKKYPELERYYPTLITMLNLQLPIIGTINIIHELKARGYTLYVFSNIGPQSLTKLSSYYPEIFELFSGFVYTQPEDNWIHKPQKAAYEKFLNKFNVRPEQVIFIDDKRVNLTPAQEMGFNIIHFTSPEQLKKALKPYIGDLALSPKLSF
jgi:HAD superfamily hydrolase (TIGR01509 family)